MAEKILTVSVAAYNVEKTLRETLDSLVVPEILDKLEVFVVDDGGTDGSLKISQEYEQKYPGTFHAVHKENGGYGSTVNYSIAHATGKYFKLLDGDDWYDSESLAGLVTQLEKVDVDMVITPYVRSGERSGRNIRKELVRGIGEGKYFLREIPFSQHINMYFVSYQTKLIQTMELRLTEHSFYTDAEYANFPIPFVKTVYVWQYPLYWYRTEVLGQSMSLSGKRKHYNDLIHTYWSLLEAYKQVDPKNIIARNILEKVIVKVLNECVQTICLLERNQGHLEELIDFCKGAKKECPDIVKKAKKRSKLVFCVYTFPYWMYPLWNWICIRRFVRRRGGD